ncbi:unnamed protein product [Amoebophrya sp. A120]|nr:unnamed protein product [Amoebophrya sp. A120]|eukprot:GSA120T00020889001.1
MMQFNFSENVFSYSSALAFFFNLHRRGFHFIFLFFHYLSVPPPCCCSMPPPVWLKMAFSSKIIGQAGAASWKIISQYRRAGLRAVAL